MNIEKIKKLQQNAAQVRTGGKVSFYLLLLMHLINRILGKVK